MYYGIDRVLQSYLYYDTVLIAQTAQTKRPRPPDTAGSKSSIAKNNVLGFLLRLPFSGGRYFLILGGTQCPIVIRTGGATLRWT